MRSAPVPVLHLVDAIGQSEQLWGKERVVAWLMREQRASGAIDPRLVTFTPGIAGRLAVNLVGKALKMLGLLRRCRLVNTCHGWIETDANFPDRAKDQHRP